MVREKVGVALNSGSLEMDPNAERAVDRVAALGSAVSFGSELWHLKYGGQITRAHIEHVARRVARALARGRRPSSMLQRVAMVALAEWLHDRCPACHGRKFLGGERWVENADPVKPCPRCDATGYLVSSDTDRARALGVPRHDLPKWQPKLDRARDMILNVDMVTGRMVANRLKKG